MDFTSLKVFVPEIFLSISILFQLFLNACIITNFRNNYPIIKLEIFSQSIFTLFCLFILCFNVKIEAYFFNFLFSQDISVFYVKLLIVFTSIFSLLPVTRGFINQNLNFFEYYSIFLISLLSTLLLVCCSNLLSVYLILEMQTLCFYIMASFNRDSAFSTEAGLKYFVIGSFISGLFLFGSSNIYGLTGTLNFNSLMLLFNLPFSETTVVYQKFILFSILIITVVFLFKVSAVPFHFWSPDVYEGSPLASTIVFSLLPKFAIFYLFLKWLFVIDQFLEIKNLLLICGIFSIFLGSFMAIKQKRLKRLIIYSSIAQTGFLLVALSVNSLKGLTSIYFFLIIYVITSILVWIVFSLFFNFQNKVNIFFKILNTPIFLSTLSSFFKINQIWSVSNVIIFFSLAGIPPLVGFFSKLFVISAVVDNKNLVSSFILLMVSAVSIFYYLRIIKIIFFDKNLTLDIEYAQIIFNDVFFEWESLLFSFFLFLLLFLFFYPYIFILVCNLSAISFFLF